MANKEAIFLGNRLGKKRESLKAFYSHFKSLPEDKLKEIFEHIDRIYENREG